MDLVIKGFSWCPCFSRNEAEELVDLKQINKEFAFNNKDKIKSSVVKSDPEVVQSFVEKCTEAGLLMDFEGTSRFFEGLFDEGKMRQLVSLKDPDVGSKTVDEIAKEKSWEQERPKQSPTLISRIVTFWKKYSSDILHFIPSQIDLVVGAYNFVDFSRSCASLWEKNNYLDILAKVAVVVYAAFQCLNAFFSSLVADKVYLVTAAVLVTVAIFLTIYNKFLRPMPDEFVHFINKNKECRKQESEENIEPPQKLGDIISLLNEGHNVCLHGKSGAGKTCIIKKLIQLSEAHALPDSLQKRVFFEYKVGEILDVTFTGGEIIATSGKAVQDFASRMVIVIDEFDRTLDDKRNLKELKRIFFEAGKKFVCLVALSEVDWQKLVSLDNDGSLRRRLVDREIISVSDGRIKLILYKKIFQKMKDVHFSDGAVNAILTSVTASSSENKDKPSIGKVAKALRLLDKAYAKCKATLSVPAELNSVEVQNKQTYELLCAQKRQGENITSLRLRQAKQAWDESKEENLKIRKELEEIFRLKRIENAIEDARGKLTYAILDKTSMSERDRVHYLWLEFFAAPAIKKILQEKIGAFKTKHSDIPCEVNAELITKVSKE